MSHTTTNRPRFTASQDGVADARKEVALKPHGELVKYQSSTKKKAKSRLPWLSFIWGAIKGAAIGIFAGAVLLLIIMVAAPMGIAVPDGNHTATLVLVFATLIGALIGYASAAHKAITNIRNAQKVDPA